MIQYNYPERDAFLIIAKTGVYFAVSKQKGGLKQNRPLCNGTYGHCRECVKDKIRTKEHHLKKERKK